MLALDPHRVSFVTHLRSTRTNNRVHAWRLRVPWLVTRGAPSLFLLYLMLNGLEPLTLSV